MKVASKITLFSSLLLFSSQGPSAICAHEVKRSYEVEYLRQNDAVRVLENLDPSIKYQVCGDELIVTASYGHHMKFENVLNEIDQPIWTPETRNVVLHKNSAKIVAKYFNVIFGTEDFFAVADGRTNRVFLLSSPQNMDVAEFLITQMDRF